MGALPGPSPPQSPGRLLPMTQNVLLWLLGINLISQRRLQISTLSLLIFSQLFQVPLFISSKALGTAYVFIIIFFPGLSFWPLAPFVK